MSDIDDNADFLVKAQEHIEVISTEDERIKIIGEELANDTGRAIFGKISQGMASTNDLAKSLDVSLPLVNWHITRLLGVGLIKIEKIELSSKNKQMKFYGPVKTAFVIVPPGNTVNAISKSKKEAIFLQLRHYLASIAAFVIIGPIIYLFEKNQIANQAENVPEIASKNVPHAVQTFRSIAPMGQSTMSVPSLPTTEPSIFLSEPVMLVIAVVGATMAFFGVYFGIKIFHKLKKKM